MIAVYGLFAVAGAQVCYFNAVRYLPVGIALLLEYLGLVLVVIWMWAMHGQRPRRLTLGGSVIAILGLDLRAGSYRRATRTGRRACSGVSAPP